MKTLSELIVEAESFAPKLRWLLRLSDNSVRPPYFANLIGPFAQLSFPTYGNTAEEALQGAINRAREASISGGLPNEILEV